jgi:hypothetical protein
MILAAALLVALATPTIRPSDPPTVGDELEVSLLTVGPGAEVWERWSHNTIIITDRIHGTSESWNWGLFDFRQEDFLLRFIRGRMWYSMGGRATDRDLALYRRRDRSMQLQRLNLPPAARVALRDSLRANDTDERRNYFYDYYRDNCSTRVRDALDMALGGVLERHFADLPSGRTWRWETRRITSPQLPLYLGILLGEGRPVDAEMTRWEEFFLPVRLEEGVREVRVDNGAGEMVPLVASEQTLHTSTRFTDPAEPRRTWPLLLGLGLAGGLILALLGRASAARWARTLFTLLGTTWSLLAGLGSLVLLGLWFLTDHWVSRSNENVLLLTPLSLILAVGLPVVLRRTEKGERRRGLHWMERMASITVALAVVALLLKLLPQSQYNLEAIALVLPLQLGLFAGLIAARRSPDPR